MNVSEVMTKRVRTVLSTASFKEAWSLIVKKHINALPVVNQKNQLIGILTREDMLRTLYPDFNEFFNNLSDTGELLSLDKELKSVFSLKVSHFMQKSVIYTRRDTAIMRALARMIARRVDQLPVIDDDNVVVGMIAKSDIFTALYAIRNKIFLKNQGKIKK